jgi:hypothetical protein
MTYEDDGGEWIYLEGALVRLPRADLEPQVKQPEIPPEVHNKRPINAQVCMEAVRNMSRGGA